MTKKGKRRGIAVVVLAAAALLTWRLWPDARQPAGPPATLPAARATTPRRAPVAAARETTPRRAPVAAKQPPTRPKEPPAATPAEVLAIWRRGVKRHDEGKRILQARGPEHEAHRHFLAARTDLSEALLSGKLVGEDQIDARRRATELAEYTILSRRIIDGDPYTLRYTVQAGDKLQNVERRKLKLHVPWQILLKINGLRDARLIRAGQTMKMLRGPCHAVITKSTFTLDLYLQRESLPRVFIKRLRVGLGRNGTTPVGAWRVALGKKMERAPWNPPPNSPHKRKILWDEPGYPLGTKGYWISLEGTDEKTRLEEGYGIHGTNDPSSIGRAESLGCIRLAEADIELVYSLLYEKWSTVQVRP